MQKREKSAQRLILVKKGPAIAAFHWSLSSVFMGTFSFPLYVLSLNIPYSSHVYKWKLEVSLFKPTSSKEYLKIVLTRCLSNKWEKWEPNLSQLLKSIILTLWILLRMIGWYFIFMCYITHIFRKHWDTYWNNPWSEVDNNWRG